jgi:hypothetical protein
MHGPTCIFWANLTPFSFKLEAFAGLDFNETLKRLCLLRYGKVVSLTYQQQMSEYERESRAVALHVIQCCIQAWAFCRRARYDGPDKRRHCHPFWLRSDGLSTREVEAPPGPEEPDPEEQRAARLAAVDEMDKKAAKKRLKQLGLSDKGSDLKALRDRLRAAEEAANEEQRDVDEAQAEKKKKRIPFKKKGRSAGASEGAPEPKVGSRAAVRCGVLCTPQRTYRIPSITSPTEHSTP